MSYDRLAPTISSKATKCLVPVTWVKIIGGRKEVPLSDGLDTVVPLSANNLGQVVHTHVPVTKQYNLVPVKER